MRYVVIASSSYHSSYQPGRSDAVLLLLLLLLLLNCCYCCCCCCCCCRLHQIHGSVHKQGSYSRLFFWLSCFHDTLGSGSGSNISVQLNNSLFIPQEALVPSKPTVREARSQPANDVAWRKNSQKDRGRRRQTDLLWHRTSLKINKSETRMTASVL